METWALLIVIALGYIACFLAGYWLCKSRYSGLGKDSAVLSDLAEGIEGTEQRVGESAELAGEIKDRIDDLVESGGDIEDIFLKYAKQSEENAKLEQSDAGNCDCLPEP